MTGSTTTSPVNTASRVAARPAPPGPCRVERLSDSREHDWEAYTYKHDDGTVFHTTAWRRAVRETFGHEPVYLLATRNDSVVGLLPLFLVDSLFAGRMLVSVPYAVGGGIIADDANAAGALFEEAKAVATERDCVSIDLRQARAQVPSLPVIDRYVGFCRPLPETVEGVLASLPRKARAAARNARHKFNLTVSYGDRHLWDVWRLYALSMRRLGSIAYPCSFFRRLIAYTPGKHWVSLVRRREQPVAGLVTFLYKGTVMPYFFGCTGEAKRCSAANFVYLTAMERGVAAGYRRFDLGRSRRDNLGSFNFKRFQGFEPQPLGYQMWTPSPSGSLIGRAGPASSLTPDNPKFRLARRIWRYLPLPITNALGAWAAKHIPG